MEDLHYVFPVEHCFLQYTNLLLATGMQEQRTEFLNPLTTTATWKIERRLGNKKVSEEATLCPYTPRKHKGK
jgi:nicotinamide mononucleotide adenylyltransferase